MVSAISKGTQRLVFMPFLNHIPSMSRLFMVEENH